MTCYPSVDAILFNEQTSAVPDYDAGPPIVRGVKSGQVAFYLKQDGQWYTREYNASEQLWETGGGGSVAWDDITGKPSTYTPSAHSHPWSDITGKPYEYTPTTHTHTWEEMHDIGWQPLTLLGSWANWNNAAYEYAAYRSRNNLVTLRGVVVGGSPGDSNICRLPLSCRPQKNILLPIVGGHSLMTLYVLSDGYIRTAGDSTITWRSLNCQFFKDNS
jgi:hypothetical protein